MYIGIDPGKSGGIAWLSKQGHAHAIKMPETEKDLWNTINILADDDCFCYIEKVWALPGVSVKSAFNFGQNVGQLGMALTAAGIPSDPIRPQVWQQALGCMTKGDKNVSKNRAQKLFPKIKITHAIADALLIAEYCRRVRCGEIIDH